MSTLIVLAFVVIAGLLAAMWLSPAFKAKVVNGWGVVGAALLAILTWIGSWFVGSPPTIPPM